MESTTSIQSFSVDFLLGELAASTTEAPDPNITTRLAHGALQAQLQAELTGDFGSTLVTQVEHYLADAAEDLQQFSIIAQQLGDMCVDHSIAHELSEESEHAEPEDQASRHGHAASSHTHEHHTPIPSSSKKPKSRRRQRRSLLDLYIWRLQQQKN
jgi:hypothetical protein